MGTRVKKVKAYPFAMQLKSASGAFPGQVVKLAPQGLLAEVKHPTIQPGEKFEVSFETPVQNEYVNEHVVVVKIYSSWSGGHLTSPSETSAAATQGGTNQAATPTKLIEVHFITLSSDSTKAINSFLRAIHTGLP